MNIFEKASKVKLKFPSKLGKSAISVSDLWDLPLTSKNGLSLDSLAIASHKAIKETAEVSFVSSTRSSNTEEELRLEILKHIIDVRLQENAAVVDRKAKAEKIKRLDSLIESKENEIDSSKTIEQLRAERSVLE